jgi:hypothetical protein
MHHIVVHVMSEKSQSTDETIALDPDRFVSTTVNDNGQIYVGRDLGGDKIHIAIEIVEEPADE